MGKEISCKWKEKTGVLILIGKTDFKTKAIVKTKRIVHTGKQDNPAKGCNSGKHLCSLHRGT